MKKGKNIMTKVVFVFTLITIVSLTAIAQAGPGGPGSQGGTTNPNDNGTPPAGVPFDGGFSILLLGAGALLGNKKKAISKA